MDELSDDLREDISEWVEDIREAFADSVPIGGFQRKPPMKERIRSYLSMTPQQRQALFLEPGPEGYNEFVQSAVNDLVRVYGANASAAMSWFMGVGPEQQPEDTESEMIAMLGRPVDEGTV